MRKSFEKYPYLKPLLLATASYALLLIPIIDRRMVGDHDAAAAYMLIFFGLCVMFGARLYFKDLTSFFNYFGVIWFFANYNVFSLLFSTSNEREVSHIIAIIKIINGVSLFIVVVAWIWSVITEVRLQNKHLRERNRASKVAD